MRFLLSLSLTLGLLSQSAYVSAKSVFAHVVVGNTAAHTQDTWAQDITLAKNAGIDAFVLNIAYPDSNIPGQVQKAFAAAEAAGSGFKLLFAFDYLGGGQTWPATGSNSVVSYLLQYKNSPAYFHYNGCPFVSTFEGRNDNDIAAWAPGGPIRSAVGSIHFVPDWSSLGPQGFATHLNNVQGAFNWGMWPEGANNKTTESDLAWKSAIGSGKTFMMGVSPWFFHSTNGGKKWVWRGDSLWADRWAQTLEVNPEFVQIVTWNDFGESMYVGPVHFGSEIASGAEQYVDGMSHESWLDFLPYYIAKYKGDPFVVSNDQMQYWYRTHPAAQGNTCDVVGNNNQQGQTELSPNDVVEDAVFFSALLSAPAEVHVQIGNNPVTVYQGSAGINHWSQRFNGQMGVPKFSVVRMGLETGSGLGKEITARTTLASGCSNYNAWVGSFQGKLL